LKEAMERGHASLRKASKFCYIPTTFLLDHLNSKTRSKKVGSQGVLINLVLINEEDKTFVVWVLGMQDLKLSITL
jgi:hypothetical protein